MIEFSTDLFNNYMFALGNFFYDTKKLVDSLHTENVLKYCSYEYYAIITNRLISYFFAFM